MENSERRSGARKAGVPIARGVVLAAIALSILWVQGARSQGTKGSPGPRQGGVVEGVAAVVGNQPIMRSEVDEQFTALAPQFQVDPSDTSQSNQLRREILDNLISEQLLTQQAEKEGLKVDDAQIKEAVDSAVQGDRERLGAEGFANELKKEGINEEQLRQRYGDEARKELLRRQLLQKEVFSKVSITDADVQKAYQENKDKIGKKPRALRVLDLFVRTTP